MNKKAEIQYKFRSNYSYLIEYGDDNWLELTPEEVPENFNKAKEYVENNFENVKKIILDVFIDEVPCIKDIVQNNRAKIRKCIEK